MQWKTLKEKHSHFHYSSESFRFQEIAKILLGNQKTPVTPKSSCHPPPFLHFTEVVLSRRGFDLIQPGPSLSTLFCTHQKAFKLLYIQTFILCTDKQLVKIVYEIKLYCRHYSLVELAHSHENVLTKWRETF
jgi:hypothetical protein